MAMSIRLSSDDEERLTRLARRTGRSKTFYVREAIHQHLDEIEERYWADTAVRDWEAADKPTRPAQVLWDELGV